MLISSTLCYNINMKDIGFTKAEYTLSRLFKEADAQLYAVGGQIRNPLLGLPVSDRDICSALPPEKVIALCAEKGIKYIPQGIAYGTVALLLEGESYEHTTFRSDSYGAGGAHKPETVSFGTSYKQDAMRRDFTVNALYAAIPENAEDNISVLDPTGRGLDDLNTRIIRASSDDPALILRDDALRILRLVRFACELGFECDEATFAAAKRFAGGLADISAERIRQEFDKILLSDLRYDLGAERTGAERTGLERVGENSPVYRGLAMLDELRALDVFLPEVSACRGISQRAQYHAYDVMGHLLHSCACTECTPGLAQTKEEALTLRLAALLHDIGKPAAKAANANIPEKHGHMYGHDGIGASMACAAMARLKYPRKLNEAVCFIISSHMFDLTGAAKESTLRERFAQWGLENSLRLCAMREADVYGSGLTPKYERVETAQRFRRVLADMRREHAPFSEKELCCTGEELMRWTGMGPGEGIGRLKTSLLLHCARHPQDNRPEKLERLARDIANFRQKRE